MASFQNGIALRRPRRVRRKKHFNTHATVKPEQIYTSPRRAIIAFFVLFEFRGTYLNNSSLIKPPLWIAGPRVILSWLPGKDRNGSHPLRGCEVSGGSPREHSRHSFDICSFFFPSLTLIIYVFYPFFFFFLFLQGVRPAKVHENLLRHLARKHKFSRRPLEFL